MDGLLFRQICSLGLFSGLSEMGLHGWWAGGEVGARSRERRAWIRGISETQ